MNLRTLKRQTMKAAGVNTRNGPAKASDGSQKGPSRTPSQHQILEARRAAMREAKRAAKAQATWPGDEGYCSALHRAFDAIENEPSADPLQREREAFAKHLRSREFLASGLGLVLGEKP